MARIDLPQDPNLAGLVVQSQTRQQEKSLEMGWIGRIIGTAEHKPGNIVVLVVALCFLFIAVVIFSDDQTLPKKEIIASLISIITLALGYFFGKKSE